MMWKIFFLLIASAAASEYDDNDNDDYDTSSILGCEHLIFRQCEKLAPNQMYPENRDQLQEFCKGALDYFRCSEEILETCEADEMHKQRMRKASSAFSRICDEDSIEFAVLADTLPCIHENVGEIIHCSKEDEEVEIASNLISSQEHGVITREPNECLIPMYIMGCAVAKVGNRCGDLGKDVLIEFVLDLDPPIECSPDIKRKLPDIARALQNEYANRLEVDSNEAKKEENEV